MGSGGTTAASECGAKHLLCLVVLAVRQPRDHRHSRVRRGELPSAASQLPGPGPGQPRTARSYVPSAVDNCRPEVTALGEDGSRESSWRRQTGLVVTTVDLMEDARFARLERVPARDCWTDEAGDFTPWLAQNIDRLADALGLSLAPVAREHAVGRYSLDLLLEDDQGRYVIVENQFGGTNHGHFGQLLTYAAGTEASVVVWIAEHFNEEHLAGVQWLNDHTEPGVAFFAVEVECLRIEGSRPAPHLRVVAQPNEWKQVQRAELDRPAIIDWGYYAEVAGVPQARVEVAKAIAERLEAEIVRRGLPWRRQFNRHWISYKRAGGYNVFRIGITYVTVPRLALYLDAPIEELGEEDPLPMLESGWLKREHAWSVPSVDDIPELAALVELASRYHPT